MVNFSSARSLSDCAALAEAVAEGYPSCLGWQACLEPLLPAPIAGPGACIAFLVDEQLGPHFVFDGPHGLIEVRVEDAQFGEALSPVALFWLRAFEAWHASRTSRLRLL